MLVRLTLEQSQNPVTITRKEATLTQLANLITVLPIENKKPNFSTKLIKNGLLYSDRRRR